MSDSKKKDQKKQPRGRPVKNIIEPIDAMPEEIAKAICLLADKQLREKRKIKN